MGLFSRHRWDEAQSLLFAPQREELLKTSLLRSQTSSLSASDLISKMGTH